MAYEYLDLLEQKLDDKQKECCCSMGNIISAAGAGSGKTQVLATRFAWLVMSQNIPVSQILTLTFTKKAAGEMYERIYKTLNFFAKNQNTPETEKERAKTALAEFNESRIQTLDSYCNGILKQSANQYGIRPDFSSGTSDSEKTIKDLSLPFVFKHSDNLAIKTFAKPGQYQKFAEDLLSNTIIKYTSLATPKNYFNSFLEKQKKLIIRAFNYFILGKNIEIPEFTEYINPIKKYFIDNKITFCISIPSFINQVYIEKDIFEKDKKQNKFTQYLNDNKEEIEKICMELESSKEILESDENSIKKILNFEKQITRILNFINNFNFTGFNTTSTLKTLCKLFKDEISNIYSSIFQFILNFEPVKSFTQLLDIFMEEVNESKRESGKLTFKDISELALKILQENAEIRKQEQENYRIIMIDEFQDNNSKNKELLFCISGDEKKLFFVGDEKQSIYKFRGADVSVFNSLKNNTNITSTSPMTYNYRSSLSLITSFNILFGNTNFIFDNKAEQEFEATYKEKAYKYDPLKREIVKEIPLTEKTVPIHVCTLDTNLIKYDKTIIHTNENEKLLSTKDQNGYFIAKKIKQIIDSNKSLKYSDFAVLDKSRTNRYFLTKWLDYFNIPYHLDANSSFFNEGPINDIYNYLRLCVYPSDKNAYAGYLASPFSGKNFYEISDSLLNFENFNLPDKKEILSSSITKTISKLWIQYGYYYEVILNKNTNAYEEQFDLLFEIARECDENNKSLSWFVDQLSIIKLNELSNIKDEAEIETKEINYPIEKNDGIQIMTIHKSKGLQFKHVFINDITGYKKKGDQNKVFLDEVFGPTIQFEGKSNNFFYNILHFIEDKKQLAEFRRLIYVALTRAIESIYIIGNITNSENTKESYIFNCDYKLMENAINHYYSKEIKNNDNTEKVYFNKDAPFDFQKIIPVTQQEAYTKQKKDYNLDYLHSIYEMYQNECTIITPEIISNRKTPSSLEINKSDFQIFDQDSGEKFEYEENYLKNGKFTAADFGTLIHSYLENQANNILPQDYNPEQKLLKNLSKKEIEEKKSECIKMCRDFKNSELGKKFDEAKNQNRFYKAEYAFRMFHEGYIFTGSIDLIFENKDSSYTLVDYKSDNEIDIHKYEPQQACYKTAAAKLLGIEENQIRCSLYFLKHNKEVKLFNN